MSIERTYLGVVADYQRDIADGKAYDHLIPPADHRDTVLKKSANLQDTVKLMKRVIAETLDDTAQLAPLLQGRNIHDSCRKLWHFVYHHIQYKLDKQGVEQIRRPRRAWADRKSGVDCDCYTVFQSSVLHHLGIPHKLRITKYWDKHGEPLDYYQHVYVVVPDGSSKRGHRVLDPVLDRYDYEKPYYEHKDYDMDLAYLSGPGGTVSEDMEALLLGTDYPDEDSLSGPNDELDAYYKYLLRTRNVIRDNPDTIKYLVNPQEYVKMLDYAIRYWNTPQRDQALAVLAEQEAKLHPALSGLGEQLTTEDRLLLGRLDDDEELGGLFKNIGKAIKNVGKKVGNTVKKVGEGVKKFVKNPLHVLNKLNPATVLARNGYLLYLKTVGKKQAQKLKWGYLTDEQARAKRFRMEDVNKWRSTIKKVEDIYDKIGGEKSKLKDTILKAGGGLGYPGQFALDSSPLTGLGEPATAAMLAAAASIAAAVGKLLQGLKDRPATEGESVAPDTMQESTDSTADAFNLTESLVSQLSPAAMTTAANAKQVVPDTSNSNSDDIMSENNSTTSLPASDSGGGSQLPATTGTGGKIMDWLKKYWWVAALLTGGIVLLVSKKARRTLGLGAPPRRRKRRKQQEPKTLTGPRSAPAKRKPAKKAGQKKRKARKPRSITFK